MKNVACIIFVIFSTGSALKCKAAAGTDAATCTNGESVCSGPMAVDYTGISSAPYKCGPCTTGKDTTCKECDTDGCNTAPAMETEFKCRGFEQKDSKWQYVATNTTCKRKSGTKIQCNMPANETTKAADWTKAATNGCGPCTDAEKKKGSCKECKDKALCNTWSSGARALATATLFVPLVVLAYALL